MCGRQIVAQLPARPSQARLDSAATVNTGTTTTTTTTTTKTTTDDDNNNNNNDDDDVL